MTAHDAPLSFRQNGQLLFLPAAHRLDTSTPEKRLALAVLADAVRAVQRRDDPRTAEDEAWFASHATDHPFAFEAICQVLGLDGEHVRRGVQRLRRVSHAAAA